MDPQTHRHKHTQTHTQTHAHTQTHTLTQINTRTHTNDPRRNNFKKPGSHWPMASAQFKKFNSKIFKISSIYDNVMHENN